MRTIIFMTALLATTLLTSPGASAGAPFCNAGGGTPYCSYTGRVVRAYVNDYNIVLLYFDTPFDLSRPTAAGYTGVNKTAAAAFHLTDESGFGRAAYSTLLAANARGAIVSVQMRETISGYAKIDRIWINE